MNAPSRTSPSQSRLVRPVHLVRSEAPRIAHLVQDWWLASNPPFVMISCEADHRNLGFLFSFLSLFRWSTRDLSRRNILAAILPPDYQAMQGTVNTVSAVSLAAGSSIPREAFGTLYEF